jgi:hypothetical protein
MGAPTGAFVALELFAITSAIWKPGGLVGSLVAMTFKSTRTVIGVSSGFAIGGAAAWGLFAGGYIK